MPCEGELHARFQYRPHGRILVFCYSHRDFLTLMSWPLQSDFIGMLKNPPVGFRDPELKQCTVEMNQLGQPKARSGNFATVYRGFRPDGGEFAIRVFNRRHDERLAHYRAISEYLQGRAISSVVRFQYDPQGIRSSGDGKLYPLLTMEWIPGTTLFEWLQERYRDGQFEALRIAAEAWVRLVRELAEHEVIHGDLQHGNVMVSSETQFKLVDYDCMGVPSLLGRRNLETGLPPYQHPGRDGNTELFSGLDNFSALVIYVALRALAASPELWHTYVLQPAYDRILFREDDFRTPPSSSPLYRDLLNSPDRQVRELTYDLFELARHDLRDVPRVDELLMRAASNRAAAVRARPCRFRSTAFPQESRAGAEPDRASSRQARSPPKPTPQESLRQGQGPASRRAKGQPPRLEHSASERTAGTGQGVRPSFEPPLPTSTTVASQRSGAEGARREWFWWFVGSAAVPVLLAILTTLMLLFWRSF